MLVFQQKLFKQDWWKIEKRFRDTFKFSINDINNFILLLRIGVYPYESMDGWNWFNKTTLSDKGNNLNMEILDIWNKIMEKMFVKILK